MNQRYQPPLRSVIAPALIQPQSFFPLPLFFALLFAFFFALLPAPGVEAPQ